ncbi:MAG: hypothetical protein R6U96_16290 [Promethearchaeia archaeon]
MISPILHLLVQSVKLKYRNDRDVVGSIKSLKSIIKFTLPSGTTFSGWNTTLYCPLYVLSNKNFESYAFRREWFK